MKKYALTALMMLGAGVASAAEGDAAFTTTTESLKTALQSYVDQLLPILGDALVLVLAFAALWAVYRIVRRVLSSAA